MMIVVERIEENFAVLEITETEGRRQRKTVLLTELPDGVSEGDVLAETVEGFVVDTAQTRQRRLEAIRRLRHLKQR